MRSYVPRNLSEDGMVEDVFGSYHNLTKYIRMDDYTRVTQLVNEQREEIERLRNALRASIEQVKEAHAEIRLLSEQVNAANRELLTREHKLRELCCAHGNALMQIHDKYKEITRLRGALRNLLQENEDYIKINNLSAMGNINLVAARQALTQEPTKGKQVIKAVIDLGYTD